jgi:hypothetical protein
MGWVSATQYEPEFWGKLPVVPPAPLPPFRSATKVEEPKVEPKVEEPKVVEPKVEPKVEEPKAEPKVVDTAPAVKRVAKKTTPKKQEPKTEQADDKE